MTDSEIESSRQMAFEKVPSLNRRPVFLIEVYRGDEGGTAPLVMSPRLVPIDEQLIALATAMQAIKKTVEQLALAVFSDQPARQRILIESFESLVSNMPVPDTGMMDAARRYGLVAGGPSVNTDRCQEILTRGAAIGITPAADSVERFSAALIEQQGARRAG